MNPSMQKIHFHLLDYPGMLATSTIARIYVRQYTNLAQNILTDYALRASASPPMRLMESSSQTRPAKPCCGIIMTTQGAVLGPRWRLAPKTAPVRRWRPLRSPACLGCHAFQGRGADFVGPALHRIWEIDLGGPPTDPMARP